MSVTVRTGDLISSLEAILPGDRRVITRSPKHVLRAYAYLVAAAAAAALAAHPRTPPWVQSAAKWAVVLLVCFYLMSAHTVLNFTGR